MSRKALHLVENLVPSAQTLEKSSNSYNRNIQYKPGPEVRGKGIQAEKAAGTDFVTQDIHLYSAGMYVQLHGVFYLFLLLFSPLQNILMFYDVFHVFL